MTSTSPTGLAPVRTSDRTIAGVIAIIFGLALLIQLLLGTSIVLVGLCGAGIVLAFTPYLIWRIDLYTILAAYFGIRYLGAALLFKCFKLQTLDSNISLDTSSFALTALLMGCTSSAIVLARQFDTGRSRISPIVDRQTQRKTGLIAFWIGFFAAVVVGFAQTRRTGIVNQGALFVTASLLLNLCYYGIVSEVIFTSKSSQVKNIISLRLIFMIGMMFFIAMFLNIRGILINSIVSVFVPALLSRAIKFRHLALGAVVFFLMVSFVSPVVLELRSRKEGLTPIAFLGQTVDVFTQAATQPDYLEGLKTNYSMNERYHSGLVAFDYYGDRSNILNRLSFIALVDAVNRGLQTHEPVGFRSLQDAVNRNIPRLLNANKASARYQHGDWLSWQMGMMELGRSYSAVFGMPLEGLASFGVAGLVIFPFLFLTPTLWLVSRAVTFRYPTVESIFAFVTLEAMWTESTTDVFMGLAIRDGPVLLVCLFIVRRLGALSSNGLGRSGKPFLKPVTQ